MWVQRAGKSAAGRFAEIVLTALVIVILTAGLRMAFRRFYRAAYPLAYRGEVLAQAAAQGVEPALVFAVIRSESGFNPGAVSEVDARGLMQITQETFEWAQYRIKETEPLHFDDLFDSGLNIRYGTAILALLLEEFGSERNTLCAYHAGWGTAKRWLQDPACSPDGSNITFIPSGATGGYVRKVLETKAVYERLYTF